MHLLKEELDRPVLDVVVLVVKDSLGVQVVISLYRTVKVRVVEKEGVHVIVQAMIPRMGVNLGAKAAKASNAHYLRWSFGFRVWSKLSVDIVRV